jgi:hypothetical protein
MRKDVLNPKGFKMFDGVDISGNQTSPIVYVPYLDNVGIVVAWSGTTPVGELVVEVSNQQENPNETITWTALDFGAPITISGNSGDHAISCNNLPFNALRLKYNATSGTGNLTATLQVKMV